MTRFMMELTGKLGDFWCNEACKELARVEREYESGEITIDRNGVARNRLDRILANDELEKLALITDRVNVEATQRAYNEDLDAFLANYRKRRMSEEELFEARSAFGEGTVIVDVFSGERVRL